MTDDQTPPRARSQVLVSDGEGSQGFALPYSKGLMASRMMVTGLSPARSYQVAERIEERLADLGQAQITSVALSDIAVEVVRDVAGERYAKNFLRWQQVERLDVPLVLLIGGATGVGKSTIATQLAARLGIVRVVATDAIREVMRGLFSRELMPTLYTSSFDADTALREAAPLRAGDRVIVGFREQTAAVSVGLRALLERAAVEGTSLIIEGAHAVPGFVDLDPWTDQLLPVHIVVTVEDDDLHQSHFVARGMNTNARPAERYIDSFDKIRKVQKYIRSQALQHEAPIIPNYNLDQTLASIIDLIVDRVAERVALTDPTDPTDPTDAPPATPTTEPVPHTEGITA